ncbi:hypothetical protein SAMN04487831_102364 [Pseudobutyrivibrio sp. UC1225]|uniref:hypothetical protein n=1 Tax=Pseudobutyrivibrio sp. UC1225 TaxID=1798185 RepID=UPI0008E3EA3A|nr:hypothetical protein [Pseudobutyrivibrio sp. UC1225]SFN67097.1 hypothetical protein SAMN04487831_102364 [Pseudobutyrivibrio sp. UC1225]
MKKIILLGIILQALCFIACSGADNSKSASDVEENQVVEEAADDTPVEEEPEEDSAEEELKGDPSVDIDLTVLSATFVYSEVYNMVMEPEVYIGEKVKMEGTCSIYTDEKTGKVYYACIIKDATQCCAQGLEFTLDEEKYTQEDYPKEGDFITISGTFDTYSEGANKYLTVRDSELIL